MCLIFLILSFQIYSAYSQTLFDTESYLNVIQQEVFLNDKLIDIDERILLTSGDTVRTSSVWRAIIEWGDGSITRVWEWSELYIEQAKVNSNRTQINISFELLSWRTWSNVISFLWSDSSFTQKIEWLDAGVRWTVFDVDLEAGFIRVSEHVVELRNNHGESIILTPETPFDIVRGAFIDFDVFLRSFQDIAWTEFNKVSDNEFRNKLLEDLHIRLDRFNPFLKFMEWFFPHYRIAYELDNSENFESSKELISRLSQSGREKTKILVQSRYQDFNFISPSEELLYGRKIRYQEALLLLSDDTHFQQSILERTMFDLQASAKSWNIQDVEALTSILISYSEIIPNIESSLVDAVIWWIWTELWNELDKTRGALETLFQIDFWDISFTSPDTILDGASRTIENFLEDNFWDTIRNFLR